MRSIADKRMIITITLLLIALACPLLEILFGMLPTGIGHLCVSIVAPALIATSFILGQPIIYYIANLTVIGLVCAILVRLLTQQRKQAWRDWSLYFSICATIVVVIIPLAFPIRNHMLSRPGVQLIPIDPPSYWNRAPTWMQFAWEMQGNCVYEPLGWIEMQSLVYRKICGIRRDDGRQGLAIALPLHIYRLDTGQTRSFNGDIARLYRKPCNVSVCVEPYLADRYVALSSLEEGLRSPDGKWVAFVYGSVIKPEEIFVIANR
jgi:hypothetical protein